MICKCSKFGSLINFQSLNRHRFNLTGRGLTTTKKKTRKDGERGGDYSREAII